MGLVSPSVQTAVCRLNTGAPFFPALCAKVEIFVSVKPKRRKTILLPYPRRPFPDHVKSHAHVTEIMVGSDAAL